jgi:hypothetical protein
MLNAQIAQSDYRARAISGFNETAAGPERLTEMHTRSAAEA